MHDHFAAQDRDTEYVRQRFGVEPERLTDLFALAGDSSLYIYPVLEGLAYALPRSCWTIMAILESVLAAAGEIPGNRGRKIQDAKEAVMLAQQLVTLRSDVNIGCQPEPISLLSGVTATSCED